MYSSYVTTEGNNKQFCLNVKFYITYVLTLIFRGDFDAADLGGKTVPFFDMMRSANQTLLNAVKSDHPVGFFGLKMLCGKSLHCCCRLNLCQHTFYEVYVCTYALYKFANFSA